MSHKKRELINKNEEYLPRIRQNFEEGRKGRKEFTGLQGNC